MKIKNYKGRSLKQIYDRVRREMGPDAVVVSSRRTSSAWMSLLPFGGAPSYELVAVAEERGSVRTAETSAPLPTPAAASALAATPASRVEKKAASGSAAQPQPWQAAMALAIEELRNEVNLLRRGHANTGTFDAPTDSLPEFAMGWSRRFVHRLKKEAPCFFDDNHRDERRFVLQDHLNVVENFPVKQKQGPHTIVFVGPTGCGKTTTLAKLAARWSLDQNLKIGIVTTDTYRVAATDQVKEYATLLGVDLKIAFTAREAAQAVKSFADRDVILVDTAGRSHYDHVKLKGLCGMLEAMGPVTVLLLAPAIQDKTQIADVVKHYSVLKPNYLVITKVDETRNYDILTYLAAESTCPITFITNGQRVPQDIKAATASELSGMLLCCEEQWV